MSQGGNPIRYGIFLMPVHDGKKSLEKCIEEDLQLVVRAEELGFSEFWIGEHHSSIFENIIMPEIFIAQALAMTKNMRLGPAPVCLQYHHPAHVAGRLAFLDHLSHGRLNLCFGPGAVISDIELFGIEPKESNAMVAEAVDMILHLWTTDPPWEIQGKFWQIRLSEHLNEKMGLGHIPKPLQKPYPPIAAPAMSRDSGTMKTAGARGFLPIAHHMLAGNVVANVWETYEKAALEAGREPRRSDWRVSRNIFVADTTKEARERARHGSMGKCLNYLAELTGIYHPDGRDLFKRDLEMPDSECNMDYFMKDGQVIAGDPDQVVQELLTMTEETGEFGTLIFTAHDWDDRKSSLRCLELFAREVMPAFNRKMGCG